MTTQILSGATGVLMLADGTVLSGIGVGATGSAVGEVVFNTAMSGYQEILTDPSYMSQILAFTFPHIGNVGVNLEDVEQIGEAAVRITLAVAGFTPDDLSVTVEGRQLTITGKREDAGRDPQAFLHRGIAARGFVRSFVLADGLEISGAQLEHGLLHVDLIRPEQEKLVRRIPITTTG